MTKLENSYIDAINNGRSNGDITIKKNGLFVYRNGISQNFGIIIDDTFIIRIDHNCKGIYKKILKHHQKINKDIILGTDIVSKFMINNFTEDDAEEMIPSLFQYGDPNLIRCFNKYELSLKSMILDTAKYFDLYLEYYDLINSENFIKSVYNYYSVDSPWWQSTIKITPIEVREEYQQLLWLDEFHRKNRNDIIESLLEED